MKKQWSAFWVLSISFSSLFAQQNNKVNADLFRVMHDKEYPQAMIDVLVKGNVDVILALTRNAGGVFKYAAGNISSVRVPVNSLSGFISRNDIIRIESYKRHIVALNDTMRVRNNVNEVQQGQFPLTQGYDGKGIVVGFIDSGVDFTHPDFKDSLHHSRIKWIWDMVLPDSINTPTPYGYGQEWTNTEIDDSTAGRQSGFREFGHGTHVTGVGTGNGLAAGVNKGVAPKADIIMVAFDFNYTGTDTRIADAVHYIFSKADSMGEPCVINASLGDYFGSHDGQDLEAQLIDADITAKNGRCMVAAAGNWGNLYLHLGYNVSNADTNFTWYQNNSNNQIYFQMWGDSNSFKNIHFAVAAEDTNTWSIRAIYSFSDISTHLGIDTVDTLFNGVNPIAAIETAGSTQGGLYEMEFLITPDSGSYLWRLMMTGNGYFDLWSTDHYKGVLPSPATLPSIVYYKSPDLIMNTSNSFACSNQVITVANYVDRNQHFDCMDSLITTTEIAGALTASSSIGPTRDRRQKPDIAATGDHTLSCAVTPWLGNIIPNSDTNLGLGCYHIAGGGTSAASPVVAGIAALYLQKYPNATNIDVKNAITGCAKTDAQTGSALPDYHWGYGKADAFHALTGCPTDIEEALNKTGAAVYPNPFSQSATLVLNNFKLQTSNLKLIIYNVIGSEVRQQTTNDSQQFTIEKGSLTSGMYFYDVINEKQTIARGKLIIAE